MPTYTFNLEVQLWTREYNQTEIFSVSFLLSKFVVEGRITIFFTFRSMAWRIWLQQRTALE